MCSRSTLLIRCFFQTLFSFPLPVLCCLLPIDYEKLLLSLLVSGWHACGCFDVIAKYNVYTK